MKKELDLLFPLLNNPREISADSFGFFEGEIGRHRVCVMQCGIGKVNAALGCRALIQLFNPELIINTGVAGGTGAAKVLDVVAATGVGYHDVWCGPDTSWGQAAGCPALFPAPEEILNTRALEDAKKGVIASGDVFVDSPQTVSHVLGLYPDALGVDMESAAIAQTCYRFNVPFLALRVISDTPGQVSDNGAQYASFWQSAPAQTFGILKNLLEEIG